MKTNTRILLLGVITATLPAPGAGAVLKYKGIFREADAQVGQWSDALSVAVAG